MIRKYPDFKRGELVSFFEGLSSKEKKDLEEYLNYRYARGCSELKGRDVKRQILQIRLLFGKDLKDFELKDLREVLALLNSSGRTAHTTNEIKANLKNYLKWRFKDWSERFSDLEDIKLNSNPRNEEKINSKNLLTPKDIEKMMKTETKMFWKAFFITQYESALRTKEVRFLKWEDINFNVDEDISELNIYSTKTKKARVGIIKEATYYLKKLREEQENNKDLGIYVFHGIGEETKKKPIDKGAVSKWMRKLSQKALGREIWCYLLRHSRATELYRLAREGRISKDTAIQFMGHSEDMSSVYTHLDQKEVKKMMKNQIYKLEDLPPEKKHELEIRLEKVEELLNQVLDRSIPTLELQIPKNKKRNRI